MGYGGWLLALEEGEVDGPLAVLAKKLTVGPPSLGSLIALLDQGENIQEFVHLVREFLPDREHEILGLGAEARIEAFCRLFSERYFQLEDDMVIDEGDYAYLVYGIPIPRAGLSYDDWHEFDNFSTGHQLLLALVECPYYDRGEDEGVSARVPLLEQCAKYLEEELVRRIDPKGWNPETLHSLLDGGRFEGAALFADWVWQQTNTAFLDLSYEEEMYGEIPWTREVVDELTEQHQRARQMMDQMRSLSEWLEDAPQANFAQLLDAIVPRNQVPKEQLPLPLVEIFTEEENEELPTDL